MSPPHESTHRRAGQLPLARASSADVINGARANEGALLRPPGLRHQLLSSSPAAVVDSLRLAISGPELRPDLVPTDDADPGEVADHGAHGVVIVGIGEYEQLEVDLGIVGDERTPDRSIRRVDFIKRNPGRGVSGDQPRPNAPNLLLCVPIRRSRPRSLPGSACRRWLRHR
jgi:hypothetical protein